MTDNEIIKALECCQKTDCNNCPNDFGNCYANLVGYSRYALDLINRQKAEIENLEYKLLGVMHFVDKWLNGAELEQDEVNRASAMREKTLQIVEKLEEENDFLKSIDTDKIKAEAIKEFAERLKNIYIKDKRYDRPNAHTLIDWLFNNIDNLVKEMVGEE